MQPLLEMIFSLSLAGTLLGLFLMLLTRIFGKKLPPAFTYYAWLIVLLRSMHSKVKKSPLNMKREKASSTQEIIISGMTLNWSIPLW